MGLGSNAQSEIMPEYQEIGQDSSMKKNMGLQQEISSRQTQ